MSEVGLHLRELAGSDIETRGLTKKYSSHECLKIYIPSTYLSPSPEQI